MQYMILIYDDEKVWGSMKDASRDEMMASYFAYSKEMKEAGVMRAGDALQPTATATTVRLRQGKTLVTDGPFAETKEQLGGYYLLNARDLNEAIQLAARIPAARLGSVEVRPVIEFKT